MPALKKGGGGSSAKVNPTRTGTPADRVEGETRGGNNNNNNSNSSRSSSNSSNSRGGGGGGGGGIDTSRKLAGLTMTQVRAHIVHMAGRALAQA